MAEKLITVYAPDGTAEQHTRPNARDLVNGANYSWDPKYPSNPASLYPYASHQTNLKSKPQEIFDRIGAQRAQVLPEKEDEEDDLVPLEVVEPDEEVEIIPVPVRDDTPPVTRGRAPRARRAQ